MTAQGKFGGITADTPIYAVFFSGLMKVGASPYFPTTAPLCLSPSMLRMTFFPCQYSSQSKSASPPATRTTRSTPSPPPPQARSTWCSPNPPATSRMRTSSRDRQSWRYIPRIRHRQRRIRNALRGGDRRGSGFHKWFLYSTNMSISG